MLRRPTAWLYESAALEGRVLELSYGTRLPVLSVTDDAVEVARPDGGSGWLRRAAVALHDDGAAWPELTGARLVAEARRFLGLQYLWAGTSGFGYDCSGFTHAVFRALGDDDPPRRRRPDDGRPSRRDPRPAARRATSSSSATPRVEIHHVGMCVGDGKMIHAPRTGSAVSVISLGAQPYASEFAGGRRLTP